MNNKIESMWYINNEDMVWIRYYVDENAVIWYNYKDICEKVNLDGRKAIGMYKDLSEGERQIFFDLNNEHNKNNYYESPFITEEGLYKIEKQVVEKFGIIYKNMCKIKQKAKSTDNYQIKTEKDVIKDFICDAVDKDALIDFTVDERILRNTLDYEYDESGCITMYKKEIHNEEEGRIMKYKKHKESGGKSSCPSWLKDVIK